MLEPLSRTDIEAPTSAREPHGRACQAEVVQPPTKPPGLSPLDALGERIAELASQISAATYELLGALNENVINQGLFYLDWLMDHRAEFELLVMRKVGKEVADGIDWGGPRLVCIAGDFTKYDEHAVQQMNRNIELIRHRRFGDGLLLLELVNAATAQPVVVVRPGGGTSAGGKTKIVYKTVSNYLDQVRGTPLHDLYEELKAYLESLGDDVQVKTLRYYVAFKRIKNFACVEVHPKSGDILVFVKVDPDSVTIDKGFTRDVRNVGHFGTGDLQIRLASKADLERARPLLNRSYEAS